MLAALGSARDVAGGTQTRYAHARRGEASLAGMASAWSFPQGGAELSGELQVPAVHP
jgi:hypothetical protein